MTELLFTDPCVLFALRRESAPFYREFRPQQRFPGAPCRARFCGPAWLSVLVLETGIGPERCQAALQWLFGKPVLGNVAYRPGLVLSAGFSGGLHESLHVGDIVLATAAVDTAGNTWPTTWPGELPPGEWQPPLHRGRVLGVADLVSDPAEKRRLGAAHNALAVDMETPTVARLCSEHGVPFGCVRAITDDMATPLSPQLLQLFPGGRLSPLRLLTSVLRSPRLVLEMTQLARNTRLAAQQLSIALGELLTLTLPGGAEL